MSMLDPGNIPLARYRALQDSPRFFLERIDKLKAFYEQDFGENSFKKF